MNDDNTQEVWKVVADWRNYEVSSKGRVRNRDTGHVLNQRFTTGNRRIVTLYRANDYSYRRDQRVHELVARAFLGRCPDDHHIGHKDGNTLNNCLDNLGFMAGSAPHHRQVGSKHSKAKLTEDDVREIRRLYFEEGGYTMKELGVRYGVSQPSISQICSRQLWKHV